MIIAFAGHALIASHEAVKAWVKEKIRQSINGAERIVCYLGGYGDFDGICARACKELKEEGIGIESVYVTPYMDLSAQAKYKDAQQSGLYDSVLYPPLEGVPPRFAISRRNEWMMVHADVVIAYVSHTYGGACKALRVAERRKKKIINLCDDLLREKPEVRV